VQQVVIQFRNIIGANYVPNEQKIGDNNKKLISYANVCKSIKSKVYTSKNEPTLEDRIWYLYMIINVNHLFIVLVK
jgi:hypothetical protein